MKNLIMLIQSGLMAIVLVGCQGNANLYNGGSTVTGTSITPTSPKKPECPIGGCKKACALPSMKDYVIGEIATRGQSAGACNICIDTLEWDMLSDSIKDEVQNYTTQHKDSQKVIADGAVIQNGECYVPPKEVPTVCRFPDASNYNQPLGPDNKNCCILNYCNDPDFEEFRDFEDLYEDYKDFYASLIPSEEPQSSYDWADPSLCITPKAVPAPPEICAVTDVVCLPYRNDNSATNCDPALGSNFRGKTIDILKNDHDTGSRPFSLKDFYIINEDSDKVVLTNSTYVTVTAENDLKINECIPYKKINYQICVDDLNTNGTKCDTAELVIDRTEDCVCTVCGQ